MSHPKKRTGLIVLAGGLAMMLVGPLLIPVPRIKGTFPPRELADEDSEFIELKGMEIHIKKKGQGEPVFLLLHGFAASLYSWNAVMEPLARLGTVIAYDRPGFGLSAHPISWKGQNPYGIETQVDLVSGLLDHYGVQRAILVGNSAGGTVAMQAALAHPERIAAMILVDPAVYHGGGAPGWLQPLLASPQMRRLGPLFTRQILSRGRDLIKLAWHDPSRLPPELEEYYLKPFKVENWDKAFWEFTLASRPTHLAEHLDEFSTPILVITGDDDRIVPTKDSLKLADEIPGASLVVISQAGHVPHEEQPEVFMTAITSFLSQIQL
jgi:pimeloyl-ACP methyl ester carboxylesterase